MGKNVLFPQDLYDLAERVITENKAIGRMVALAESCTGGLVCAALTEVPGSSAVLDRGFVTYSNESKQELLGVQDDILETFGAVSPATAWAMAQGAIRESRADIAVAISGVAGPEGGSDMKPVGTVVFACAIRGEEEVNAEQKLIEGKTRAEIRHQAAIVALELLLPKVD
ncbi:MULTISPECIES: CinA family protein [Novosphingobium]|uniref:CinA-like protein n=1 Tax=Novosphingobium pentaromativorans US6-1 TaxID=1088721 RepID=G6EIZ1_9SPHN|nr:MULTISPECIES: CinA family protein [Novosphingobium]AIT78951.1 competence protein [Novosphingobium pentaromativorans US6-1]EHJ58750.1 CinA-like protein [Novosphingobium pentaromativorans US6-1]GFM29486.1 CinA-like protein [Novosphingobium sp. PY1]CCA93398.1 CinA-like [Novosphingobium sp. PP1Y]